jgi:hypothetical protein
MGKTWGNSSRSTNPGRPNLLFVRCESPPDASSCNSTVRCSVDCSRRCDNYLTGGGRYGVSWWRPSGQDPKQGSQPGGLGHHRGGGPLPRREPLRGKFEAIAGRRGKTKANVATAPRVLTLRLLRPARRRDLLSGRPTRSVGRPTERRRDARQPAGYALASRHGSHPLGGGAVKVIELIWSWPKPPCRSTSAKTGLSRPSLLQQPSRT